MADISPEERRVRPAAVSRRHNSTPADANASSTVFARGVPPTHQSAAFVSTSGSGRTSPIAARRYTALTARCADSAAALRWAQKRPQSLVTSEEKYIAAAA